MRILIRSWSMRGSGMRIGHFEVRQKITVVFPWEGVVGESRVTLTNHMSGGQNRLSYVDSMKGFACLCVVLGHIVDGYFKGNIYPESNRILFTIFNIIYAFHMPFFMMISGYVYSVAYFDSDGEPDCVRIHKQIGNIIIVYVLFSVLFGLTKMVVGNNVNDPVSLTDVLLIWRRPISPYWYLYDLVLLYLTFTLSIFRKGKPRIMVCILMAIAVLSHYIMFDWFQILSVLYYMYFFYIGFSDRHYPGWLIGNKKTTWEMATVSILISIILWDKRSYVDRGNAIFLNSIPIGNLLIAVGISLMLWYLFQNVCYFSENKILQLIGRHCMEIYVLHCFFTAGFRTVFFAIGVHNLFVSVVINLVFSTSIPLAVALLCEKLKIHDLIFKPITFFEKNRRVN